MKKTIILFLIAIIFLLMSACANDIALNSNEQKNQTQQIEPETMPASTAPVLANGSGWVLYEDGLLCISSSGSMGYISNSDKVKWHEYRSVIKEVYIEDGITSVCQFAFQDCINLHTVRLPSTLKKVQLDAFCGCVNLKEIALPDGLETIEFWAFALCDSLQTLEIPGTIKHLDNYAFQECKGLQEITILPGVETIGFDVFDGCVELQSITIPNTVKSIDVCTFRYCTKLENVFYGGTEEEWNTIEIKTDGNEPLFAAKIHYNTK